MGFQIGANIRKIRELRGYTQEYMAQELGVSQKTYSNIEADKFNIDNEQVENIAKVLDIEVMKLFTFDDKILFHNNQFSNTGVFNAPACTNTVNNSSEKEQELYEKQIKTLEDQVEFLKKEIEQLHTLLQKK